MFRKARNPISYCEGVSNGHPDKLSDLMCDAILDEYLKKDPLSHVGIEALLSTDLICITGEVESSHQADIEEVVKKVLQENLPNSLRNFPKIHQIPLVIKVHQQSQELARIKDLTQDQAVVFGYAAEDSKEKMPYSLMQVRHLFEYIDRLKQDGTLPFLADDAKALLSVNNETKEILSILVSYQHDPKTEVEKVRSALEPYLREWSKNPHCEILINPMGDFIHGSILADSGVSGRKIIYESYGSEIPHGGGAMSGKDPYKVDRWGAFLARKMALTALKHYDLKRLLVELAFSPGSKGILGINVDTFGSHAYKREQEIAHYLLHHFPIDVLSVVQEFNLTRPIYYATSKRGAFGNPAPWDIP